MSRNVLRTRDARKRDDLVLAIDVGNTNIVLGLFHRTKGNLRGRIRLSTERNRTADELAACVAARLETLGVDRATVRGVVVGSVVSSLDTTIRDFVTDVFGVEPLFVTADLDLGLPIRVEDPKGVGADRIVNALAARERFGAPTIVVDLGTATTFDVVSRAGEFVGGIIVPGVRVASNALSATTSRLPKVEIVRPRRVVGRTTVGCLQSGLYFGTLSMAEGLIGRIVGELRLRERPPIVATGGLAPCFSDAEGVFDAIAPDLTLEGLFLAHERQDGRFSRVERRRGA